MDGVQPGEIKKLLVLETLPKPINYTGGMEPLSYGGTFTLERMLGTVPVEPDGSAYFELPALRSLFFVALDEQRPGGQADAEFHHGQPGETTGCVGCHEQRTQAAARRPAAPAGPAPPAEPRSSRSPACPTCSISPATCSRFSTGTACAATTATAATGGRDPQRRPRADLFSISYFTLTARAWWPTAATALEATCRPARSAAPPARLMKLLDGSHYGVRLTARERKMVRLWIESAAAYPGHVRGAGLRHDRRLSEEPTRSSDRAWPSRRPRRRRSGGAAGLPRRVAPLPQYLSEDLGLVLTNPDFATRESAIRGTSLQPHPSAAIVILLSPFSKPAAMPAADRERRAAGRRLRGGVRRQE